MLKIRPLVAIFAGVLLAACARSPDTTASAGTPSAPRPSAGTLSSAPSSSAPSNPAPSSNGLPDFTSLVERYGDAVVNVTVVGHGGYEPTASPEDSDDPLRDFFKRFGMPSPRRGPSGEAPLVRGEGSGFIVSPDGYILTNAHVVSGADEVTVRLTDRREFSAKVTGSDQRTDVAVVKIDAGASLPVVRIGDPHALKTGEWVLAIGSPFGLESTATAGIVSGTSRAVGPGTSVPFIQTDVAVNPGNSGGPLFNLRGEVIGINSMIFSQTGGYMGISFAIPIDLAMQVREQLVKTGHVVRGRIGVAVQDVDASLARSFGLDKPRGALVSAVEPRSPAQKADLKPGDVILEVEGKPIVQSNDLANLITQTTPGSEAKLKIWRSGKEKELTVHVEEMRDTDARADLKHPGASDDSGKLGLAVRPLTPDEKRSADTDGNLVIMDVTGPAQRAGLQPGDIILAINDRPLRDVKDLRTASEKLHAGDAAALLIEREGNQIFVPLRIAPSSAG
jgi:serine protease Do